MPATLTEPAFDKSTLSHIYITDTLDRRPATPIDPAREKRAILDLASAMADRPAEVLPQFVALAMALTGATSSGLSLYEDHDGQRVFRWRHLHGLLAPFEDATTPRNDSPCGVTLDQNRTVLASHPELIYDWISVHDLIIPEVLLQPLYIGSDEPLGTLWIVAPRDDHFSPDHARILRELADFAGKALKMIRTESRLRSALDEQELLAREMSHRLNNMFAMTDGMIRGSARSADSVEGMADALSSRLHAMASAHALVMNRASALAGSLRTSDIADLIGAVVKAHDPDGSRFTIGGCALACGSQTTNAIALIVNELATNAAKYGALSVPGGRIETCWTIEDDELVLSWREQGGPAIAGRPDKGGFGMMLLSRTVQGQLRGRLTLDWAPRGLTATIAVPMAKIAQ